MQPVAEANRCPGLDEIKPSIKEEEEEDTIMAVVAVVMVVVVVVLVFVVVVVVAKRGGGRDGRKVVPRALGGNLRLQGYRAVLLEGSLPLFRNGHDDGSLGIQNRRLSF